MSEGKPVTHKLLKVRDKHVGLFGGRGSFISKRDPEVVLYLAEAVCASSEFIGTSYHKLFQALP